MTWYNTTNKLEGTNMSDYSNLKYFKPNQGLANSFGTVQLTKPQFATQGAVLDTGAMGAGTNNVNPGNNTSWFDSTKNILGDKDLMTGLGIAGQGVLGLAGFLQNQETLNQQRKLTDQQLSSNRTEMDNRNKFLGQIGALKSAT